MHESRQIPAHTLSHEPADDGMSHAVLWVTTWTHLLCEQDTNAHDGAVRYTSTASRPSSFAVLQASRKEINDAHSVLW